MTNKRDKEQIQRFIKATGFETTRKNVCKLMRAGRVRRHITKKAFNTLSNQGHHHPHFRLVPTNPWTIFTLMMLMAFLLYPCLSVAVQETELETSFDSRILPFFSSQFQFGTLQGAGGVPIHYAKREITEAQAALIIVDGRTEYADKYAELLYDLKDLPWSFYIYDHRGQGRSGRLLNDPQKGHVDSFSNYVNDLKRFIKTIVKRNTQSPLFILAHSMGGTIAALYGMENPGILNGMIFCSPMLRINTMPFPGKIARLLAQGMTALGDGDLYVFGGRPYDPARDFAGNDLTHSAARFKLNKKILEQFPENQLGSPTFQWLTESFKGMAEARENAGKLKTPVLIIQGDADTVVGRKAEKNFCSQLPNCTLVHCAEGRHELLMEKDAIRNTVLERIKQFIKTQSNNTISDSGNKSPNGLPRALPRRP